MKDLKKIKQQKAFQLPDNYFSHFEDRLMEQLSPKSEERQSWLDQLIYQLQPRFSIPTFFALALAVVVLYIQLSNDSEMIQFTDADIEYYLLENFDAETQENIYAMVFPENQIINLNDTEILEYLYESDLEEELLEEYLP